MEIKSISSNKLTPMQDFILVKPSTSTKGKKEEETTESGLVLSLAKEKSVVHDRPTHGIILSCGPDCKIVKAGMEVFWDVSRGQDMFLKDGEFVMLMEQGILGYRHEDEDN